MRLGEELFRCSLSHQGGLSTRGEGFAKLPEFLNEHVHNTGI